MLVARLSVMRWPRRRVVLAGVVVIAATGIAVNALVLQSARHPAPLFAAVEQARRAAAAAPQKPAAERPPLPPTRPASEQAAATPTPVPSSPSPATAPSNSETTSLARLAADAVEKPARANDKPRAAAPEKPAPRPATQEANAKPAPPKGDALGEMIRGGIVPPGGIPSEPDPKILQVQQRLARLGHANVKPDGFMGPATRAAIEKFERDRKWSVTGEMSPRLVRELGTVSASRP
jgi:hypothetical protein